MAVSWLPPTYCLPFSMYDLWSYSPTILGIKARLLGFYGVYAWPWVITTGARLPSVQLLQRLDFNEFGAHFFSRKISTFNKEVIEDLAIVFSGVNIVQRVPCRCNLLPTNGVWVSLEPYYSWAVQVTKGSYQYTVTTNYTLLLSSRWGLIAVAYGHGQERWSGVNVCPVTALT